MKILLTFCTILLTLSSFAQVIEKPFVESVDDRLCYITKIERTTKFTIVSFEHKNNQSSINLNPQIYIKANDAIYTLVKSEGIPLSPEWHAFKPNEGSLNFKAYFQPIPKGVKTLSIHETEPKRGGFNFYGVRLDKSRTSDEQTPHFKEDEPGVTEDITVREDGPMPDFSSMMNQMGPMYNNIMKAMLNSITDYYSQPGKLAELAKLNRAYYDALLKEGFSTEQALQIVVSGPLSKSMSIGK